MIDFRASHQYHGSRWHEQVTAPVKLGLEDLMSTLMKLGSAVTFSSLSCQAAETLGAQLIGQRLRHVAGRPLTLVSKFEHMTVTVTSRSRLRHIHHVTKDVRDCHARISHATG